MAVLTLEEATARLRKEYQDGRLIPFLGAGFSKPLKLPGWSELVGWMAEDLGFERELFDLHGRAEQLAEYYALTRNLGDLVYKMTLRFDSDEARAARKKSRMHLALSRLDWRTIYSTNYDCHIEGALEDAGKSCVVLASFEDFQGPRPHGGEVCEVIKFHGTLSRPETVVLTESMYFRRMALEAPSDQRLRADLLSHSFMFIGYSFSDTNIRYIWYRMQQLRLESQKGMPQPHARRCFCVTLGVGPVQPEILDRWNIDIIQLDPTDPEASVAELLHGIG